MGNTIREYRRAIEALLADAPADADWTALARRHRRWIGYFQHERLIHLLVTLFFGLFALLAVLAVLISLNNPPVVRGGIALAVLLLGLLIPYIRHYFLLENNVQALYPQADALEDRALGGAADADGAGGDGESNRFQSPAER